MGTWGVQGRGAMGFTGAGPVRTLRTPTKVPLGAPRGCQQGSQGHLKSLT